MGLQEGKIYYLINDGEKAYFDLHYPTISALFSIQVNYNGNTWACELDTLEFGEYDVDWDEILEDVSFETAQYYKSGIFFDTP